MGLPVRIAAALFLCLLAAAYFIAWRSPATGTFHDDGVYLVTAKALAEGKGYRIISLPEELPQTKYPILFPALLSVIWKLNPAFPSNLPLLRLVPLLGAVLWFWLSYRLFREEGESPFASMAIVALAAAAPWVVFLGTALLSETLFAALLTACLLLLRRMERGATAPWLPFATGVLAAAAFHTRTAGIVLAATAPLVLLIHRRLKDAVIAGATAGLLCLPWFLWVASHPVPADGVNAYYSNANYQGWNILVNFTLEQKIQIFLSNVMMSLGSPLVLSVAALRTGPAIILAFAIGAVFAWAAIQQKWNAATIFMALYVAILLCWAFPPYRFYAPVLPLLYYWVWKAVPRYRLATAAVAFTAAAAFLLVSARDTLRFGDPFPGTTAAERWEDTAATMDWLRRNTPADAVLSANLDPMFYLYTGRKAVRGFNADPFQLVYEQTQYPLGMPDRMKGGFKELAVSHWVISPCTSFMECKPLLRLAKALTDSGTAYPIATGLPSGQVYKINAP